MALNAIVIGSTGLVGQRLVYYLSNHPWFRLIGVTASDDKVGKRYEEVVRWSLEEPMPSTVKDMKIMKMDVNEIVAQKPDIVFTALPTSVSAKVDQELAKKGMIVVSHASNNRLDPDVPLLNPEVNADHVEVAKLQESRWSGKIFKVANCASTILTLALKPIYDDFGISRVFVSTMQALSGAGLNGVAGMAILDNIIPYIEDEEEKIETESLKMLGMVSNNGILLNDKFTVSATVHRVNVLEGHLEAVFLKTEKDAEVEDIKESLREFRNNKIRGMGLPMQPEAPVVVREEKDRPQPRLDRMEGKGMSVVVGRIRKDKEGWIKFNVLGHNTIRGAAGNGILIAELLYKMKII